MAITRSWKVYGIEGHLQRESFNRSVKYDFSENGKVRILEILNSDQTGTNDYSIVRITSLMVSYQTEFLKIQDSVKLKKSFKEL